MNATDLGDRDGWTCWLCDGAIDPDQPATSRHAGTVDHVVPRSRGGRTEPGNLRLAHRICNGQRSDALPELHWPSPFAAVDAADLWSTIARIVRRPGTVEIAGLFPTEDRARAASQWAVEQACRFVGGNWTGWVEPTGHADLHVLKLRADGAGWPGRPKVRDARPGRHDRRAKRSVRQP